MADRVHFLGSSNVDPAIDVVGSGLPTRWTDGTQDPTIYTISPMTLAQSLSWWWRIKTWALSTDISVSDLGITNILTPQNISFSAITSEIVLTKPGRLLYQTVEPAAVSTFELFASAGTTDIQPCMAFIDPDFIPSVRIHGNCAAGASVLTWDSQSANLFSVDGSFTAIVDGRFITIYYEFSNGAGTGTFTASQLQYDPQAYWPYAAADASPIYDTSSGVQLQDPRN